VKTTVRIDLPERPYDVVIGSGLLSEVADRVRTLSDTTNVAVVTDETVGARYGTALDITLAQRGIKSTLLTVPPGETSKNWGLAGELCEQFAQTRLGRDDLVLSLGGGVVADLAGFAAAVYLRGVDFIQVPTTLLSMVDASVGGKTAVDLRAGKNLAGAFKQPLAVFADTSVLETLPAAEWQSGLAEVAKSAVLGGEEFMAWLEANAAAVREREPTAVDEMIRRCVAFKGAIVSADEREADIRECLNYGHTLGHAIEVLRGYGTVTHGAAVAEGMRFAARVAVETTHATREFVMRQDRLLDALGLPPMKEPVSAGSALEAMHTDKKVRLGTVRMVLAMEPGLWHCQPVADKALLEHLEAWVRSRREG